MRNTISPLDIKILYEDNHIILIEKPFNIPTQQDSSNDLDLLTLLKKNIKIRYQKPGKVFVGMVHRLDRPVGGVMVFAKTSKAASRLSEQIRLNTFKKTYLAVVCGVLKCPSGTLVHYLVKDSQKNIVKCYNEEVKGSKKAILEFEVLQSNKEYSLLKINLITGRSHQIRVQLKAIEHPLYADHKYGIDEGESGQNIALWCSELVFLHPVKKEELKFSVLPKKEYPWDLFEV